MTSHREGRLLLPARAAARGRGDARLGTLTHFGSRITLEGFDDVPWQRYSIVGTDTNGGIESKGGGAGSWWGIATTLVAAKVAMRTTATSSILDIYMEREREIFVIENLWGR
ncbi:unnamed protein product, partial [Musa hybrid cultivar]